MRLLCVLTLVVFMQLFVGCGEETAKCNFCNKQEKVSVLVNGEHPKCTEQRLIKQKHENWERIAEERLKQEIPGIVVDLYQIFTHPDGPVTVRLDFRTKYNKKGRAFVFIKKDGSVEVGKILNLSDPY